MEEKPVILTSKSDFYGVKLVKMIQFLNGPLVPMYDVSTISGLNQLIGFAKFVNRDYGELYYRGVNKIFNNVLPAIMRNRKSGEARDLTRLVNRLYSDTQFRNSLKLELPNLKDKGVNKNTVNRNNKYIIEGVLQHYSGSTRFLDIVDNHWVALWMGLNQYEELGKSNLYSRYKKRVIPQIDYLERITSFFAEDNAARPSSLLEISKAMSVPKEELDRYYLYILLIAAPNSLIEQKPGTYENEDFALVDLRKALPSFFCQASRTTCICDKD